RTAQCSGLGLALLAPAGDRERSATNHCGCLGANTHTVKEASMTRSCLVRAVGIAALLLVTGCATVPKASDRLAQQSRTFVPALGKVNVYVIRPYNFIGGALRWTVTLDSGEFGSLGLRSYLYGVVEPGEHVVGSLPPQVGGSPNRVGFTAVE